MKNTAYKIEFNDFGTVVVIAPDIASAHECFLRSKYGGDTPNIKSILKIDCTNTPLVALE